MELNISESSSNQNVSLDLPGFVSSVYHVDRRIRDLLEIAAYVYCADRLSPRGRARELEYHNWSRDLHFVIPVEDHSFWSRRDIRDHLARALEWMTGDNSYSFTFTPARKRTPVDLFDSPEHQLCREGTPRVLLFSGGLDSLAGAVDLLKSTSDAIWPISHVSRNPGTISTQRALIESLRTRFPDRVNYRTLECHLHRVRAPEESQRTRAFLYNSMALAMCTALNVNEYYVHENGVTALNFHDRGDLLNARASRTAHPRTLRLMQALFSKIAEAGITIHAPFAFKTKTEVVRTLSEHGLSDLMAAAVSCSKTYKLLEGATHCGGCSQCVDRRFSAASAGVAALDDASCYALDFVSEMVADGESRSTIVDYIRQARGFIHATASKFSTDHAMELSDALDDECDFQAAFDEIFSLCKRHGENVAGGISNLLKPLRSYPSGSLRDLVWNMDHTAPPPKLLAERVAHEIEVFSRHAFSKNAPKDENDLNSKINGYLEGHRDKFEREFPMIKFAAGKVVPDHSTADLFVETKFIRKGTPPSKASEGIAADLIKYPSEKWKLFLVYDRDSAIKDREAFKMDFESKGNCCVHIF